MSEIPTGSHGPRRYEIRLKGHLESRWTSWFDGLDLTAQTDGTTLIDGVVVDQAALHGLLRKLRDVGLPLISVNQIPAANPIARPDAHEDPNRTELP